MAHLIDSEHGGNVYAAARALQRPVGRVIDFSASINPLGPSPRTLRAIVQARGLIRHYPDPDCVSLKSALAARWRCDQDRIVMGNGSTELIYLFPSALNIRHLLVVGPTFSEYARAMVTAGGRVSLLLADRADGYRPPLTRAVEAMGAKGRRAGRPVDAVVLCNPNSPTGQACSADEMRKFACLAEERGVQLIVDETFADYCEGRSILPAIGDLGRTIALRSFTKFFALPGLRAGYLVTTAETARRIRARQAPWSVNALAQAAALAALQDRRYVQHSRSFMTWERERLAALIGALSGCTVFPSHANFLLVELPYGKLASKVTAGLLRRGLLVRDCSNVPGLNGRSIRIAVRTRAENDRLVRALSRLLR